MNDSGNQAYIVLSIVFIIFGSIMLIGGFDIYNRYKHNVEVYQDIESDPLLGWESPEAKKEAENAIRTQFIFAIIFIAGGGVLVILSILFIGLYFKSIEVKEIKILCPNCGYILEVDMNYCPHCGEEIKNVKASRGNRKDNGEDREKREG